MVYAVTSFYACSSLVYAYPTGPFTISEPQDQEVVEFYVVQKCRATDAEVPGLQKGWSGSTPRPSASIHWKPDAVS